MAAVGLELRCRVHNRQFADSSMRTKLKRFTTRALTAQNCVQICTSLWRVYSAETCNMLLQPVRSHNSTHRTLSKEFSAKNPAAGIQLTAAPPQHRLYFFPEPQGQGSFRPILDVLRRGSGVPMPTSACRCALKYRYAPA
ncbi:MAG: hypothetical protein WCC59_10590, partial [Terriglobales bacterium]